LFSTAYYFYQMSGE